MIDYEELYAESQKELGKTKRSVERALDQIEVFKCVYSSNRNHEVIIRNVLMAVEYILVNGDAKNNGNC